MKLLNSIFAIFLPIIVHSPMADKTKSFPVSRKHGSFTKSKNNVLPSISSLFRGDNPLAVIWGITFIVVYTLNSKARWSFPHISDKPHKTSLAEPFFTHFYTSATVVLIPRVVRVITPRLHAAINLIFGHLRNIIRYRVKPSHFFVSYIKSLYSPTPTAFYPMPGNIIYSSRPNLTAGTLKGLAIGGFSIFKKRVPKKHFTSSFHLNCTHKFNPFIRSIIHG